MSKSNLKNSRNDASKPFAKKSLGQNFLVDKNVIDLILRSLNPLSNETIVEIGAGRGALTKELVDRAEKVFAVEIDRDLIPILNDEFSSRKNFQLIEKDALEVDFQSLLSLQSEPRKTKLVANLPYYISTAILQHLILHRSGFSQLFLMLQKEVVERIVAEVGSKKRGFLTVLVQTYFEVENLFDVAPNSFRPVPKVTSAVIQLIPKQSAGIVDSELYRSLVSICFSQKRKTIRNNLKNATGRVKESIEKNGGVSSILSSTEIDPTRRAETLNLEEWEKLLNKLSK